MAEPGTDHLQVALRETDALARLAGRGSFKMGPALKEFGVAAIEQGARRMILDLHDCQGMDSTFMGVLAGLAVRLRQRGGELHVIRLSPKTRQLLATLGIDQLVRAYLDAETPDELRRRLPEDENGLRRLETAPDRLRATETMIEAHETLTQVDDANRPRFKDVLAFLREDLKRQRDRLEETP